MLNPIELSGEYVKLVPLEPSHAPELFMAGRDREIWSYLPQRITTTAEMEAFVAEALAQKAKGLEYPFAVLTLHDQQVVGTTRYLNISLTNRNLEIGWTWYSPSVWRTRVNTECKFLLLQYAFETLQLLRVQLKADTRNERSNGAIRRIGAKQEGVFARIGSCTMAMCAMLPSIASSTGNGRT